MLYQLKKMSRWPNTFKMLYMLIIFDTAATYAGLNMSVIAEANPLMAAGFSAFPLITIVLKLGTALLFLQFLHHVIYKKKIKWPEKAIPVLILIHLFVCFLHIRWIWYEYL